MSATILRYSEMKLEYDYFLEFKLNDGTSRAFSFPCNEAGDLNSIPEEAQENLNKCLDGTYDVTRRGVVRYERSYRVPALARCECGKKLELCGDTVCERCHREYNGSGQLLAPRHMWGEETGESFC
jgi:hypothetical protein